MKKMLTWCIALIMLVSSVNALALTAIEARGMSNANLKVALQKLNDDELVKFCKEVFAGSDRVLQSRVRVQLQSVLRTKPAAAAKALGAALTAQVPGLSIAAAQNGSVVVVSSSMESVTNGAVTSGNGFAPRPNTSTKPLSSNATGVGR